MCGGGGGGDGGDGGGGGGGVGWGADDGGWSGMLGRQKAMLKVEASAYAIHHQSLSQPLAKPLALGKHIATHMLWALIGRPYKLMAERGPLRSALLGRLWAPVCLCAETTCVRSTTCGEIPHLYMSSIGDLYAIYMRSIGDPYWRSICDPIICRVLCFSL